MVAHSDEPAPCFHPTSVPISSASLLSHCLSSEVNHVAVNHLHGTKELTYMVVNHKIIQRSSIDVNSGVKNLTAHNLLSNDDNVVTSAVVALVWYVG